MKLNPDCMRDVLLCMESAGYQEALELDDIIKALPDYSSDDISYSIIKLHEAGFIDALIRDYNDGVAIVYLNDITFNGHQFLADVRADNVWNDVKAVSKKVGSNSISAISQIASAVISAIIKAQIGV